MENYKIANTLEILFNIKEEDRLQITSFNRAPDWKEGNEEYVLGIHIARDAEKIEDKSAETLSEKTAAEKPAGKHPAGIIIP